MKATATPEEPQFRPITLTITLESQEEVNQMGNLAAIHRHIQEAFGVDLDPVWDALFNHLTNNQESVIPNMSKLKLSLDRDL